MRPLINSADAYASLIEACRLNRVLSWGMTSSGKLTWQPPEKKVPDLAGYPVFDLTCMSFGDRDTRPDLDDIVATEKWARKNIEFVFEVGRGEVVLPYDQSLCLQGNQARSGAGVPVIWHVMLERDPVSRKENIFLLPFRWMKKESVWTAETIMLYPVGQGAVVIDYDTDDTDKASGVGFHYLADSALRYSKKEKAEHERNVFYRGLSLLCDIQRIVRAEKGEVVVVEGTHEAARINSRRAKLGLPKLQPVVRPINIIPRKRYVSGLPSVETGRTNEPHHRRGTLVTNKFGTKFPRRATIVNDPARTRATADTPKPLPTPWYEAICE